MNPDDFRRNAVTVHPEDYRRNLAGPLNSHPSSTASDRSPRLSTGGAQRPMDDPSPPGQKFRRPLPTPAPNPSHDYGASSSHDIEAQHNHDDIAPFADLPRSDPADHTTPIQMTHRRGPSGATHASGPSMGGLSRRATAKEKAKNWLIRPRRTPLGDYSGHALSEPIDTVKSLFSMFTTEFIGSSILAIFTMSIATAINQNIGMDAISRLLAISFTFMFGIMVTIATDSKMSANPNASFTALLLGRMSVLRTLVSILATHSGWCAGSGISKGIMGELLSEISLAPGYGVGRAFGAELIVTACVFATIFTTELEKGLHRPLIPIYVGGAFFLGHMILVDKTGASMNSARSLAPSIINGHFPPHFWVSQIPQYLASFITAGVVVAKKYILEKEAEQKRLIDPDLVESDAPLGPEILLTNREIDRNIRRDARNLYEEARQQV